MPFYPPARQVHVTVFADGPTRVLCFSEDRTGAANMDDENSLVNLSYRCGALPGSFFSRQDPYSLGSLVFCLSLAVRKVSVHNTMCACRLQRVAARLKEVDHRLNLQLGGLQDGARAGEGNAGDAATAAATAATGDGAAAAGPDSSMLSAVRMESPEQGQQHPGGSSYHTHHPSFAGSQHHQPQRYTAPFGQAHSGLSVSTAGHTGPLRTARMGTIGAGSMWSSGRHGAGAAPAALTVQNLAGGAHPSGVATPQSSRQGEPPPGAIRALQHMPSLGYPRVGSIGQGGSGYNITAAGMAAQRGFSLGAPGGPGHQPGLAGLRNPSGQGLGQPSAATFGLPSLLASYAAGAGGGSAGGVPGSVAGAGPPSGMEVLPNFGSEVDVPLGGDLTVVLRYVDGLGAALRSNEKLLALEAKVGRTVEIALGYTPQRVASARLLSTLGAAR